MNENTDQEALGNSDFSMQWDHDEVTGEISDVRITGGLARYRLPWYRRILMAIIGRSHIRKWHYFPIKRPD